MNYSKGALLRYRVIDEILKNPYRKYPTLEEILDICNEKLSSDFALETISKDIKNMRYAFPIGFDAPIKYCGTNKGYYYTDPNYSFTGVSLRPQEQDAIEEALDIIRALGGSRISENFNHAVEKLLSATMESEQVRESKLQVLQLMTLPVSRGFESFDLLYKACKERIPVSFIHYSYKKRKYKHIILHPFLVKEFENRWYVIGYSENHGSIRTFGFDRITAPVLLRKKYIQADLQERHSYLNDVYGVFPIPDAVKEKVVIDVSQLGTHYFLAYPLHESQVIEKKDFGNSVITFELIPSVELARYILSQGAHVSIIEPKWFKTFTQKLVK
ncbi:MAG: helix-turn-helix transcriptional regulator [Flavobacteriia bacterium]